MFVLLQTMVVCFTIASVALPIAFLVAMSLPKHSEFRQLCLRACYWGCAVLSVAYFGMPVDFIPDIFFPVGFADDAVALGLGFLAARKAMTPVHQASVN